MNGLKKLPVKKSSRYKIFSTNQYFVVFLSAVERKYLVYLFLYLLSSHDYTNYLFNIENWDQLEKQDINF